MSARGTRATELLRASGVPFTIHEYDRDEGAQPGPLARKGERAGYGETTVAALGLDPEKSILFRQSDRPEHVELTWLLASVTPVPWVERTPSFNVDADKGFYKCFGCGKAGDLITFVRETEQLGFTEAVEAIGRRHGIVIEYEEGLKQ